MDSSGTSHDDGAGAPAASSWDQGQSSLETDAFQENQTVAYEARTHNEAFGASSVNDGGYSAHMAADHGSIYNNQNDRSYRTAEELDDSHGHGFQTHGSATSTSLARANFNNLQADSTMGTVFQRQLQESQQYSSDINGANSTDNKFSQMQMLLAKASQPQFPMATDAQNEGLNASLGGGGMLGHEHVPASSVQGLADKSLDGMWHKDMMQRHTSINSTYQAHANAIDRNSISDQINTFASQDEAQRKGFVAQPPMGETLDSLSGPRNAGILAQATQDQSFTTMAHESFTASCDQGNVGSEWSSVQNKRDAGTLGAQSAPPMKKRLIDAGTFNQREVHDFQPIQMARQTFGSRDDQLDDDDKSELMVQQQNKNEPSDGSGEGVAEEETGSEENIDSQPAEESGAPDVGHTFAQMFSEGTHDETVERQSSSGTQQGIQEKNKSSGFKDSPAASNECKNTLSPSIEMHLGEEDNKEESSLSGMKAGAIGPPFENTTGKETEHIRDARVGRPFQSYGENSTEAASKGHSNDQELEQDGRDLLEKESEEMAMGHSRNTAQQAETDVQSEVDQAPREGAPKEKNSEESTSFVVGEAKMVDAPAAKSGREREQYRGSEEALSQRSVEDDTSEKHANGKRMGSEQSEISNKGDNGEDKSRSWANSMEQANKSQQLEADVFKETRPSSDGEVPKEIDDPSPFMGGEVEVKDAPIAGEQTEERKDAEEAEISPIAAPQKPADNDAFHKSAELKSPGITQKVDQDLFGEENEDLGQSIHTQPSEVDDEMDVKPSLSEGTSGAAAKENGTHEPAKETRIVGGEVHVEDVGLGASENENGILTSSDAAKPEISAGSDPPVAAQEPTFERSFDDTTGAGHKAGPRVEKHSPSAASDGSSDSVQEPMAGTPFVEGEVQVEDVGEGTADKEIGQLRSSEEAQPDLAGTDLPAAAQEPSFDDTTGNGQKVGPSVEKCSLSIASDGSNDSVPVNEAPFTGEERSPEAVSKPMQEDWGQLSLGMQKFAKGSDEASFASSKGKDDAMEVDEKSSRESPLAGVAKGAASATDIEAVTVSMLVASANKNDDSSKRHKSATGSDMAFSSIKKEEDTVWTGETPRKGTVDVNMEIIDEKVSDGEPSAGSAMESVNVSLVTSSGNDKLEHTTEGGRGDGVDSGDIVPSSYEENALAATPGDSGPPRPTELPPTGVVCLRGKLETSDGIPTIKGVWALGLDAILADPSNEKGLCLAFEYFQKSKSETDSFPQTGRYFGWFYLNSADGTSKVKSEEKHIDLDFIKNSEGFYNVEGHGSNVFGSYLIFGTLTSDGIITMCRNFEKKARRTKKIASRRSRTPKRKSSKVGTPKSGSPKKRRAVPAHPDSGKRYGIGAPGLNCDCCFMEEDKELGQTPFIKCIYCGLVAHSACYPPISAVDDAGRFLCDVCTAYFHPSVNEKSRTKHPEDGNILPPEELAEDIAAKNDGRVHRKGIFCQFCARSDVQGGMKPTSSNSWVHIACLMSTRDAFFEDTTAVHTQVALKRNRTELIQHKKATGVKPKCEECGGECGMLLKCKHEDCQLYLHALCAEILDRLRDVDFSGPRDVIGYMCERHSYSGLDACGVCKASTRQDEMLECDKCNQGYHIDCLTPPLTEVPEGDWFCDNCKGTFSQGAND